MEESLPLLRQGAKVSRHWLFRSIAGVVVILVIISTVLSLLNLRKGAQVPATNTDKFDGVVLVRPFVNNPSVPATITEVVLKDAGGSGNNGYLASIINAAPTFHIEGSCNSVARPSAIANAASCRHAVNGGPFQSYWSGGCIGPTISHGNIMSQDWNTSYASFGLTAGGEWIIGHISQQLQSQYSVREAVTGFGWLVHDGKSVAPPDDHVAQRTAIGILAHGELLLLQVDGCERCPFSGGPSGLSLQQLAQLLLNKGALHAINLDGGGSSTTVFNGKVQNRPDCTEVGFRCERSVTSVVCVS